MHQYTPLPVFTDAAGFQFTFVSGVPCTALVFTIIAFVAVSIHLREWGAMHLPGSQYCQAPHSFNSPS